MHPEAMHPSVMHMTEDQPTLQTADMSCSNIYATIYETSLRSGNLNYSAKSIMITIVY